MYIYKDLGYGATLTNSTNGDERFFQGDDWETLRNEIALIAKTFPSARTAKIKAQEYFENYFI